MAGVPTVPASFLKTIKSLEDFAKTLHKIKEGAQSDATIELNRDECLAIVWALSLLRVGTTKGSIVDNFREEDPEPDDG